MPMLGIVMGPLNETEHLSGAGLAAGLFIVPHAKVFASRVNVTFCTSKTSDTYDASPSIHRFSSLTSAR